MQIEYAGRHDVVDVPLPDGRTITVSYGEVADFPDDFARSLLEQPANWKPGPKVGKKPSSAPDEGQE